MIGWENKIRDETIENRMITELGYFLIFRIFSKEINIISIITVSMYKYALTFYSTE